MKHATSSGWSKALLTSSFLLLMGSLARTWLPPMLSVPAGAQVTCTAPVWHAGDVFSGQSHRHEFLVANTGRSAVTVKAVTASCGCTTYSADLPGKRIEAGQTLAIPVTWNVAAAPGKQHKEIAVHFAEWSSWNLPLKIEGEVKAAYILSSPQISFGTISPDSAHLQETTITFAKGSPSRRVTSAQCSHSGLDVAVRETADSHVQTIVVQTVPPLTLGRLSTSLLLLTEQGSVVVPIVAAVEAKGPPTAKMETSSFEH